MAECEEPGCTRPAVKNWNGMNVCADHYDTHRHRHETMMQGFD